jgi:NADH-quinone oxidoreductase subunit H
VVIAGMTTALFLGGWHLPVPWWNHAHGFHWLLVDGSLGGWHGIVGGLFNIFVFFAKVSVLLLFFIWVRWTLPRFRYDQLMNFGWKLLLPLSILNVVITSLLIVLTQR